MKTLLMVLLALASQEMNVLTSIVLGGICFTGGDGQVSGSIAGGAEQLFGKKKSKGYEAILEKVTTVGAVLFVVLSLVIVTLFG